MIRRKITKPVLLSEDVFTTDYDHTKYAASYKNSWHRSFGFELGLYDGKPISCPSCRKKHIMYVNNKTPTIRTIFIKHAI